MPKESKNRPSSKMGMVLVSELNVDPEVQRKLSPQWVRNHVADFDVDSLGVIVVNLRQDEKLYVIDGQHRVELMRAVGWGDQKIHAEIFDGLTKAQEAEIFLERNDRKAVRPLDKFRQDVNAGHEHQCAIVDIVKHHGLSIADGGTDGSISAVNALQKIYGGANITGPEEGAHALSRTLSCIKAAWGKNAAAFSGQILLGMGMVQLRYNGAIEQKTMAQKLAPFKGGAPGLIGTAKALKELRGRPLPHCVAEIIVDTYNKGRRIGKLESWETE